MELLGSPSPPPPPPWQDEGLLVLLTAPQFLPSWLPNKAVNHIHPWKAKEAGNKRISGQDSTLGATRVDSYRGILVEDSKQSQCHVTGMTAKGGVKIRSLLSGRISSALSLIFRLRFYYPSVSPLLEYGGGADWKSFFSCATDGGVCMQLSN